TSSRDAAMIRLMTSLLSPSACFSDIGPPGFRPALSLLDEEAFQRVQPGLPERLVVLQPGGRLSERVRLECAVMLASAYFAANQPGALEHHQMLGYRVERY